MGDLNHSHVARVYPVQVAAPIGETLLDVIKRRLHLVAPFRREKEPPTPPGHICPGLVYAYIPERRRRR